MFLVLLGIFTASLTFFSILSTQIDFHDSPEYIGVAKEFAGISNSKVFTGHSVVYPMFLAQFLKLLPFYLAIKLINITWLILIGVLLYYTNKRISAMVLWMFSPIVWQSSIIVSPIIPSTFFLFLGYYALKRWEVNKNKAYFIVSALSLGLCSSLWGGSILFVFAFVVAFFYKHKLKTLIYYAIFIAPTFSIRLVIDYIFFGFPLYSYARELGVPMLAFLGLNKTVGTFPAPNALIAIVIISPLLFLAYKLKFSENKEEIIFLAISTAFILVYQALITYFLFIAPLLILLLTKIFSKRQIMLHVLVSIAIIIILTRSYFGENFDTTLANDLENINDDFGFEKVIAGDINKKQGFASDRLNAVYWGNNKPFILWGSDFDLHLKNKTAMTEYGFRINPRINDVRRPEFIIRMNMDESQVFKDLPLILLRSDEEIPEGYDLTRCYKVLCVYQTSPN